jgi:hypothetical protein
MQRVVGGHGLRQSGVRIFSQASRPKADRFLTTSEHAVSTLMSIGHTGCAAGDDAMKTSANPVEHYELRFEPLFDGRRALCFPCDPNGRVDLDALSERARHNYLFARAATGRDFAWPCVAPASLH